MFLLKTKKWGNSIGIIIPKDVIRELGIKPGDEVAIDIDKKGTVLEELAGAIKSDKSTEQLLKEFRRGMESKYL